MVLLIVATLAAGLFAGAALYVTGVEHPARLSCGTALAIREFAPSYKRGTVMQASLALIGCVAGLSAAWRYQDPVVCLAGVLLGSVVPFTLVVIVPTNKRLLDPALDASSPEASQLLMRWGHLHAVRSIMSTAAFVLFVARAAAAGVV
jgi:uncharacterized membrane protein